MIGFERWTEDELSHELVRLDGMIEEVSKSDDERSRCVAAYLRQVRRDRRDALVVLRKRRAEAVH